MPQVALIGTSYSANPAWNFVGALQAALGEELASYATEGIGPFVPMVQFLLGADIERAPPRLVIWELPERALIVNQKLAAYGIPDGRTGPPP